MTRQNLKPLYAFYSVEDAKREGAEIYRLYRTIDLDESDRHMAFVTAVHVDHDHYPGLKPFGRVDRYLGHWDCGSTRLIQVRHSISHTPAEEIRFIRVVNPNPAPLPQQGHDLKPLDDLKP